MNNQMNISAILFVYNGQETLKQCLDALMAANINEVIVVNDGSTDRTAEIIDQYPVISITLNQNMGRVYAQRCGAEAAKYDNLLIIGSRVIVPKDIIQKIKDINYSPLMANIKDDKNKSDHDKLFYLIRKKIYKSYPQVDERLYIDKDNFFTAPKGTTMIYLNKELYLECLSDGNRKDASDDTVLLKNITDKGVKILRHRELNVEYIQRTNNANSWIFDRGKLWADHYLTFINRYSISYILMAILFPVFVLAVSIYISESISDFTVVIRKFPVLAFYFFAGTILTILQKTKRGINCIF